MDSFIVVIIILIVLIILCVSWRVYRQYKWGYCISNHSLAGKTCVITGASSGLGLRTAMGLVQRGARVVFACRDVEAANRAITNIRKNRTKFHGEMIAMQLDLESFQSIRNFAESLCQGFDKIDILINNAGVAVPTHLGQKTQDGFEINMGVNHLGHFLLTNLMINQLEAAAPSRVVIVSSMLYKDGKIDFDDLNLTKKLEQMKSDPKLREDPAYANSKLMNIYFGKALAERTKDKGIEVFILCPGFTFTRLFRYTLKWYHYLFLWPIFFFIMKTAKQGAQTILHCATDITLQGKSGCFFVDCNERELEIQYDKEVEERLWAVSENLVNGQMA